jgi:large subunit ribosomal protein L24
VSSARIRKNDIVVAVSGAGRGKTGKVIGMGSGGRVLVEGLRLVKKALRKSQERPTGGIVEKEAPVALSNLMPYCPHDKKGVRVKFVTEGDRKIRKCRRCGHAFDS